MAVRIRPMLPKDYDREVICHAERAAGGGERNNGENEMNVVRLTDMTHHMKSRY